MKLNVLRAAFGVALVGAVCSVQALTLSLTGYANGSVSASSSNPNFSTGAGAFVGQLSDAVPASFNSNPFYTYCVELTQNFSWGNPLSGYEIVSGLAYFSSAFPNPVERAGTILERLGKLFTYLGGVGMPASQTQSAAIQLAVWESIYEGSNSLDVAAGSLIVSTAESARDAANALLASAAAVTTNLYSISVLKNIDRQDFLLIQRIPEPASLALAGLALAGLAFARRRRA